MRQRVESFPIETLADQQLLQTTPALTRGLQILEELASSKRGFTLSELARRLKIPKSTVQRLLCTLQVSGYIHCEDETRRFFVTDKVSSLSRLAAQSRCLCNRTLLALRNLRRKSKLAVRFAVLEDDDVVIRGKLESPLVRDESNWIGKHVEIHAAALGKAILANLPASQADQIINIHGLCRHNSHTIYSYDLLKKHLQSIRYRGFAFDNEEDELGFRHVASPVFSRDHSVSAAVDVRGTTDQISSENLAHLAGLVKQEAHRLSQLQTSA